MLCRFGARVTVGWQALQPTREVWFYENTWKQCQIWIPALLGGILLSHLLEPEWGGAKCECWRKGYLFLGSVGRASLVLTLCRCPFEKPQSVGCSQTVRSECRGGQQASLILQGPVPRAATFRSLWIVSLILTGADNQHLSGGLINCRKIQYEDIIIAQITYTLHSEHTPLFRM